MASIVAFAIIKGGFLFSFLILAISITSYLEWFNIIASSSKSKDVENFGKHMSFWGAIGAFVIFPTGVTFLYLRYSSLIVNLFFLISIAIATDIGGYVFGRLIGGPKLAPNISPNKTISGAFFGILTSICVGILFKTLTQFTPAKNILTIIILSTVMSVLAQIGGLIMSKFKRHFGVKNSSNLIPGHGGFLDRADSFIFMGPFFLIIVLLHFI